MYGTSLNLPKVGYLSTTIGVEYHFIKSPSWFVFFSGKRRDKKEILLFILILCCQSINRDARTCVIMLTSYFIRESELASLRLGRDFGSVKLYSDNVGSVHSISLFSGPCIVRPGK